MRTGSRLHGGFTLVEMLVSIGIIMILVSITVPALAGARLAARETVELNHQRQSGMTILAYADDHGGAFPYYGIPGTDYAPLRYHNGPNKGEWIRNRFGYHWQQVWGWAYWMTGLGYDARTATYISADNPSPSWAWWNGYFKAYDILSATALARPSFFAEDSAFSTSDHAGQRIQHVAYPSAKGILKRRNYIRYRTMDQPVSDEDDARVPFYIWFADGHSAKLRDDQMRPGVEAHSDTYILWTGPVYTTVDGIKGRDL